MLMENDKTSNSTSKIMRKERLLWRLYVVETLTHSPFYNDVFLALAAIRINEGFLSRFS